ncbi:MAG TPA: hypothetical protein EYG11_05130 [Candidatus Latescibacteria bacterium]|nr:hypothetical protein [Candidatus Latescibacterota bacterium]
MRAKPTARKKYPHFTTSNWRGNGEAVCREHNISEQTFYRWKKKCGGSFRLGRSNGRKRLF